jgi:AAHS family benzoate transporter-like MFS transporter
VCYGIDHAPEEQHVSGHGTGIPALLRPPWLAATVLFALATLATLFAWYGLGTWLPKLMASDARFDLGKPLYFLLALNLGAVIGSCVTAWAGMRWGPLKSAIGAAALAAVGLAFLLTYPSTILPIYGALILAGVGTHGTQCLVIAAVATHYPPRLRGTSLGFALGVGRIGAVLAPQVGGWLLDANLGVGSNFIAFSLAAGVAAVLLLVTLVVTQRPVTPTPRQDLRADAFAH